MYPSIRLPFLPYDWASVSLYFLAIALGFGCAAFLMWRHARDYDIDQDRFADFIIWMLIMGVLGSRLMHVLADGFLMDYVNLCIDPMLLEGRALKTLDACVSNTQCLQAQNAGQDIGAICNPEDGLCYPQRDCLRWAKFWAGGLTVYGGLIAAVTFAYFWIRRTDWGFARLADLAGPGIFFGIAIGRLGCLAAGCCYGDLCGVQGLGIHFPTGSPAYQHHFEEHYHALDAQWRAGTQASLAVWPTQYISSVYNFLIFAFGYFYLRPRKRFHGQVILTCAIMYGICRFGIEFIRADFRGGALSLSTSQLISIPVLLGSIYLLFVLYKRARANASKDVASTEVQKEEE